jgi:hypothetical protein
MKPKPSLVAALALLPLLPLLLSGCLNRVRPPCPSTAILADTAVFTQFRPGAPADPSGVQYTAALTSVSTRCDVDDKQGQTDSRLDLEFRATRAPSADAASYKVPYFVAVTQGNRIIDKKMYSINFDFAPGAATATASDTVDHTLIALETGHPPTDYQLLAGFQISDAQRAYQQKIGPYLP